LRRPDFFIVGAPKSGTTAMNDYLKRHPEIFMPDRKEPHFFGTDLVAHTFIRDEERYLSLFSGARDEKRVGEASVWYLCSKRAAQEIKELCPSAGIIVMLRDPVEMLHSQHSQFLYNGNEDITDFEAALDAEEDRKRGLRIPRGVQPVEGLFYRESVRYAEQLGRYFEAFGRENVHVIIFDDFEQDTAGVYRRTLEFLDVDDVNFRPEFEIVNPNKRTRSHALRRFLRRPPSPVWALSRIVLPRPLRRRTIEGLRRYNVSYEERAPMEPGLERRLRAELAPEVEHLEELLGRDLSGWIRG
jgi:hypothetical protein